MVQIPSAGMSQIYITSCMQLSVPDSCISSIKVHMIERLLEGNLVVTYNKISFTIIYGAARHEYDI